MSIIIKYSKMRINYKSMPHFVPHRSLSSTEKKHLLTDITAMKKQLRNISSKMHNNDNNKSSRSMKTLRFNDHTTEPREEYMIKKLATKLGQAQNKKCACPRNPRNKNKKYGKQSQSTGNDYFDNKGSIQADKHWCNKNKYHKNQHIYEPTKTLINIKKVDAKVQLFNKDQNSNTLHCQRLSASWNILSQCLLSVASKLSDKECMLIQNNMNVLWSLIQQTYTEISKAYQLHIDLLKSDIQILRNQYGGIKNRQKAQQKWDNNIGQWQIERTIKRVEDEKMVMEQLRYKIEKVDELESRLAYRIKGLDTLFQKQQKMMEEIRVGMAKSGIKLIEETRHSGQDYYNAEAQ